MKPKLLILALCASNICHAAELKTDSSPRSTPQSIGPTNTISWAGNVTNAQGSVLAEITVDTSATPDLAAWAKRAGELCVEWYPKIATLLASEGFVPPKRVRVIFHEKKEGVADTSGDTINIAANYVRHATNDFGMVIHELTHVVQSYRRGGNPGWLVEGVADYIRLTHYEPLARRPRIDPDRASYRDAYKTTAIFLEWAEKTYDKQLVHKLNRAMRDGVFDLELFKTNTGHSIDDLWKQFTDTLRSGL